MSKVFFLLLFAALALAGTFIYQRLTLQDNRLHVVFCDVGQGDAILITTPTNKHILVDAGPDRKVLDCLAKHLPFWHRTIDLVIVTHPHSDHFSGLYYVLDRYHVSNFATEQLVNKTAGYTELLRIIAERKIPQKIVYAGDQWQIGEVKIAIQGPTKEFLAATSPGGTIGEGKEFGNVITQISYGNFDVVLTGDTQSTALKDAAERIGEPIDVLHVPHHGSASGLDENVLQMLQPQLAVISVGKNRYGHPTKHTLGLLEGQGSKILRTDQAGDVNVVSDGKAFRRL